MNTNAQVMKGFKVVIGAFLVAFAVTAIWGQNQENERLHTELIGQQEAYEQLSETVAKSQIGYVTQANLRAKVEIEFEGEREALEGRIKVLSNATFLIREKAREMGNSDLVYDGKRIKYLMNELRFADGPALGYILIFDDGRVVSKIYDHEIKITTAISRDEDSGRYTILNKGQYILRSPSLNINAETVWTNKPFDLRITGAEAFIDPTEPSRSNPRFYLWAPRLNFGFSGNAQGELNPSLGMSLSGYGVSKRDLDWKFLDLGFSFGEQGELTPRIFLAQWRFWRDAMPNTYLGAGVELNQGLISPVFGFTFGF